MPGLAIFGPTAARERTRSFMAPLRGSNESRATSNEGVLLRELATNGRAEPTDQATYFLGH